MRKTKAFVRGLICLLLAVLLNFTSAYSPIVVETKASGVMKASNDTGEKKYTRFIIKYKNEKYDKEVLSQLKDKVKSSKKIKSKGLDIITSKENLNPKDLISELKLKKIDSLIEYIQPDYKLTLSSNDPYFSSQWGLGSTVSGEVYSGSTNIESAWEESQGEGVTIGIIDTAIDINHEDLKENIWVNTGEIPGNGIDDDGNGYVDDVTGWNFSEDNNVVNTGDMDHGTHIAGIIGAVKDNGKGIAGVAPKAKVMPLKVFSNGQAYTSDIVEAIEYAEKMGVKVVNCSWGSSDENQALKEAIEGSSMLFVCAAGNSGINIDESPVYPASYDSHNVIAVASMNTNGNLSGTSNYGANTVDVAAPGEGIFSTVPNNKYGYMSGTSMAAPFVTAELALIIDKFKDIEANKIKEKILNGYKICYKNAIYDNNTVDSVLSEVYAKDITCESMDVNSTNLSLFSGTGETLRLQVTNSNNGTVNYYGYVNFSDIQYTFQEGDYIEYDVKLLNNVSESGAIECTTTDGQVFRDMPNWNDQNGIGGTGWNDISSKAYDNWYHRRINIPASAIGKTAAHWDVVGENNTPGLNYTALYDNIVITDKNRNEKKVLFRSREDKNLNDVDYQANATSTLGIADTNGNLLANSSGDVLGLQIVNVNNGIVNYYGYVNFSDIQYTFQAGDYIEYDVKLLNNVSESGAIECTTIDGQVFRDMPNWDDQNGIGGTGWNDISSKAYDNWYHRRINIPASAIGKTAAHWDVVGENNTPGLNYTALYDNIVITNGNGNEKKVLFKSRRDKNLNDVDYQSSAASTLRIVDTDGNILANPFGDILSLQVTNSNKGIQNYYSYMKISDIQYTFQTGDYIEYDVKLLNDVVASGGIECTTTDGQCMRDMQGWQDQNNISGHPCADISPKANNVWYHRRIKVPDSVVEKTTAYWDIVGENDTSGITYVAFYDNIVITNESGIEKNIIFKSEGDKNLNDVDYQNYAESKSWIIDGSNVDYSTVRYNIYNYDSNNQLIEIIGDEKSTSKFIYDKNGNLIRRQK